MHVDRRAPSATTQLRMALDLLAPELGRQRPGAAAVTPRLADADVVLALRWWVEHGAGRDDGWVRALGDPQLVHALRVVHADPAAGWTVASLAREAGTSRSAFSERFRRLTVDSPFAYVTSWRMQVARARLRDDPSETIAEVARSVGHGSEAAFSRAFSREIGHPPSAECRDHPVGVTSVPAAHAR